MSRTTDQTLMRLWQNRYDRSLGIHQWFASTLTYGAVLVSLLLLITLYFVTSTNLYTLSERIAIALPALFASARYCWFVLAGFTKSYTQEQQYAMVVFGSVAVILQTAILFSLLTENLVLLHLQQEMIGEDAFLQLAWHRKVSFLLDFVLEKWLR